MELKQLRYFMHVAELGSFTRAGQLLDVTQSVLSRQIQQLEQELHRHLLQRNGRGVVPTESGALLLKHCRGILHQVERAKEDMGKDADGLAGKVIFGIPPTVSRVLSVALCRDFRQRLPDAGLSLSEGPSSDMQEWLLTGRLDVAFLYNPSRSAELELRPMTREQLYVVGSRDTRAIGDVVTLAELGELPLVIPNWPHTVRALLENEMARTGIRLNIRVEVDSVPAILAIVAEKVGYAVLTRQAVLASRHPERYTLRPIAGQLSSRLFLANAAKRRVTRTQHVMMEIAELAIRSIYPRETLALETNE